MPILRDDEQPRGGRVVRGEGSVFERTVGALGVGAARDPLLGPLIQGAFPELAPGQVEELETRIQGSTLADVFETVGEFGTLLAPGFGAIGVGRGAATAAARGGALGRAAQRFATQVVGGQAVSRAPLSLRLGQAVGGGLGLGGEQFARARAEGEETPEALKRAATAAGLVTGFDATLALGARVPFVQRLMGVSRAKAEELFKPERLARPLERLREQEADLVRQQAKQRIQLQELRTEELLRDMEVLGISGLGAGTKKATQRLLSTQRKIAETTKELTRTERNLELLRGGTIPRVVVTKNGLQRVDEEFPGLISVLKRPKRFFAVDDFLDDLSRFERPSRLRGVAERGFERAQQLAFGRVHFNPVATRDQLALLALRLGKSPETFAKENGVVLREFLRRAQDAEQEARVLTTQLGTILVRDFKQLAKAMGTRFTKRRGGQFAAPVREAYESGRMTAVRQRFGLEVAEVWGRIIQGKDRAFRAMNELGALPAMSDDLKRAMGVAEVFPQKIRFSGESQAARVQQAIVKTLRAQGSTEAQATKQAQAIMNNMLNNARAGLAKVGNVDYQRRVPGTTDFKKRFFGEFIESDPFQVLLEFFEAGARRLAWARQVGVNGELAEGVVQAAVSEGVPLARARMLVDFFLGKNYHQEQARKVLRAVTNLETMSKLGLATFANFTQPQNNVLAFGLKNALSGAKQTFTEARGKGTPAGDAAMHALGVIDASRGSLRGYVRTVQESLLNVAGGRVEAGAPFDIATRRFLTYGNLFAPVEVMNRTLSAHTGVAVANDLIVRASLGRLRGGTLATARRRAASLGFNLDDTVRQLRSLTGAERSQFLQGLWERAAASAMRSTQFVPDPSRLPLWWQHPVGKVITQFKSFAFNQGKLIRDTVLREAAEGNLLPLGYFLTIGPAAAELVVRPGTGLFRDKPRLDSGVERYLNDIAMVGGFGIAESAFYSFRYNKAANFFLGPAVSDAFSVLEGLVQDDRAEALRKVVQRQPSFRLGRNLSRGLAELTTEGFEEAMEFLGSTEADSSEELLEERVLRKGRSRRVLR